MTFLEFRSWRQLDIIKWHEFRWVELIRDLSSITKAMLLALLNSVERWLSLSIGCHSRCICEFEFSAFRHLHLEKSPDCITKYRQFCIHILHNTCILYALPKLWTFSLVLTLLALEFRWCWGKRTCASGKMVQYSNSRYAATIVVINSQRYGHEICIHGVCVRTWQYLSTTHGVLHEVRDLRAVSCAVLACVW